MLNDHRRRCRGKNKSIMSKKIELGPTPKLNGKWKAVKPVGSNGYWYVLNEDGEDVCTTYKYFNGAIAKMIASDHNEQLKVKKALAKTPFAK